MLAPVFGDSIVPFPDQESDYGKYNFNDPYICITGSSFLLAKGENRSERIVNNYAKLCIRLKELGLNLFLVESCRTDQFLYDVAQRTNIPVIPSKINLIQAISILGSADVVVGGRYHPAIMASLGGTPCVLFDSNSHKTSSLQDLLGYESPVVYSSELEGKEVDRVLNAVLLVLERKNEMRQRIKKKVKELASETKLIYQAL
ncbi:MAG: hypothetical protein F6K17_34870 [Okeania sp. SIO3C4]|nr:hypothetical protein [Okeania sp. SIO3C4]